MFYMVQVYKTDHYVMAARSPIAILILACACTCTDTIDAVQEQIVKSLKLGTIYRHTHAMP